MEKKINIFIIFLLITSIYFPSSIDGVISETLSFYFSVIIAVVSLFLISAKNKKFNKKSLIFFIFINFSLLIFTILSPFDDFTFGAYIPYFLFSIIIFINLNNVKATTFSNNIFYFINFINISVGILILLNNETVNNFIIKNYSAGYPKLVERMVLLEKPVLTFGSHSISAFFMYLFFYLNLERYKNKKSLFSIVFCFSYLLLIFNLKSVTSFIVFFISMFQILIYLGKKIKTNKITFLLIFITLLIIFPKLELLLPKFYSGILSEEGSGFVGRYGSNGALESNINYVLNNPFRPIGFGYSSDLYYTDSGLILHWLRGTIFLVLSIYLSLYYFLANNLKNNKYVIVIMIVILSFEIGYSILTYLRMIAFLPVLLFFLNNVDE